MSWEGAASEYLKERDRLAAELAASRQEAAAARSREAFALDTLQGLETYAQELTNQLAEARQRLVQCEGLLAESVDALRVQVESATDCRRRLALAEAWLKANDHCNSLQLMEDGFGEALEAEANTREAFRASLAPAGGKGEG
jgi:chromosome segregation ATPase